LGKGYLELTYEGLKSDWGSGGDIPGATNLELTYEGLKYFSS